MKRAPNYGDESIGARIFWAEKALAAYAADAAGAHCSPSVQAHAKTRLPAAQEMLTRLISEQRYGPTIDPTAEAPWD